MLKSHSHIGCSVYEIQKQKEEHQCFQETAKVSVFIIFPYVLYVFYVFYILKKNTNVALKKITFMVDLLYKIVR